jgi:hypothetical protein
MAICVSGRFGFLLDYGSDAVVMKSLIGVHPIWASISAFFLAMPYLIVWAALRPTNFVDLLNAVLKDASALPFVPSSLKIQRASTKALVLYWCLGIPILLLIDIYLNLRYSFKEPRDARVFNYLKFRALMEVAENSGQASLSTRCRLARSPQDATRAEAPHPMPLSTLLHIPPPTSGRLGRHVNPHDLPARAR